MDHCHGTAWFALHKLDKAFFLIITSEYLTSDWAWYWCSDWSKLQLLVWISTDLLCSIIQGILDGSAIPLVNLHWLLLPILKHTQCDVVITPIIFLQILTIYTIAIIKYTPYPDTMKLSGPRPLADKRWVGPVKLLCIIMFDISKIRPKSTDIGKSTGPRSSTGENSGGPTKTLIVLVLLSGKKNCCREPLYGDSNVEKK